MIKKGEYVRTKDGRIGIYDGVPSGNEYLSYDGISGKLQCLKSKIGKHSPNIIDLIEVGDYVNGYFVERKWEILNDKYAIDLKGSMLGLHDAEFIRDVVTHEQFDSIKYVLGGKEE